VLDPYGGRRLCFAAAPAVQSRRQAPLLFLGLCRIFVYFMHVSSIHGLRRFGRGFGAVDLAQSRGGDPELPGEFGQGDHRELRAQVRRKVPSLRDGSPDGLRRRLPWRR